MDQYQRIAEAACAQLPHGVDETLIWAEFDHGLVNSSVFCREQDGKVRHYPLSPSLSRAISDHWQLWATTRPPWRTIAYRVKNQGYSIDLEFVEADGGEERRHLVTDICRGSLADGHHRYETSLVSTGSSKRGEWSFGR